MSSTSSSSSSSFSSSSGSSSSGTLPSLPRYIRSLDDLYRVTNHIDDVILYFHLVRCDPIVFEEVIRMQNRELLWIKRLVSRPIGKKPISIKWIYKEKKNVKWEVERYNARLVVKGYSQKHGIDCDEVFALVARLETILLIIVTTTQHRWKIY
jgi:hypothetical protein